MIYQSALTAVINNGVATAGLHLAAVYTKRIWILSQIITGFVKTIGIGKKMMPSDKEIEEVAKEIWHTAQSECEYTVDPTRDECRLLAKAALEASEKVRNEWRLIDDDAKKGQDVILGRWELNTSGNYHMVNIACDYWYSDSLGYIGWHDYEEWFPDEPPTHYFNVPTNTNDTSERLSNKNKDNESYVRDAYIDGLNYHDKSSVNSFSELDSGFLMKIRKDNANR